jgi:hypothetical protein
MQTDPQPNEHREPTAFSRPPSIALGALAAMGIAALAAGYLLGLKRDDHLLTFSASYLVNYLFFLSISLGALFFVALQHLVRAGWSVTVRRLAELLAANVGLMAILFLPILIPLLLGNSPLYHWSDPSAVAKDELLQWKASYFNVPFFTARVGVYFIIWVILAQFFLRQSTRQDDTGDPVLTRRMEKWSPVAMLLFAVTVTFVSFDWLMSLESDWFSTIYGLYFFAGAVVAFLAVLILLASAVQDAGWMGRSISTDHYHELGKLLLGFIVFWGYMAFSQYMLIWYANIPEETTWYVARQSGPWTWFALGLLFGHLLIPFFGLLPRWVKRNKALLGGWAVWILVFHWIDLYWLVMPDVSPKGLLWGIIDVCCMIGIGCLFICGLLWSARGRTLTPAKDPRLNESLAMGSF